MGCRNVKFIRGAEEKHSITGGIGVGSWPWQDGRNYISRTGGISL